ncbi:MAG: VWA domain-containing protein [Acidobacteriota bacterium]
MRVCSLLLVLSGLSWGQQADITSGVDLVAVGVSVTGGEGTLVKDLRQEELLILDNGRPRAIDSLWREDDVPLTIGLIVDLSSSQMEHVAAHRQALNEFLGRILRPQDQAFLVSVGNEARLVTDLTHSTDALRAGMKSLDLRSPAGDVLGDICGEQKWWLPNCGGTALWNGVYAAAHLKMQQVAGRKALIVFSDGWDTGSKHTLDDAIQAAEASDTLVYAIRYDFTMPTRAVTKAFYTRAAETLRDYERIASETGGREFVAPQIESGEMFRLIEAELRSLYVLTFKLPEDAMDGTFHKLEVRVQRPGAHVRARSGYTAAR